MILINTNQLTKTYGTRVLFSEVAINIDEKDKIGFVGVNGSGKTTLFKILTNEEPYEGEIFKNKNTRVGFLRQVQSSGRTVEAELMTVFENLYQIETELNEIAEKIEKNSADTQALINRQHLLNEEYEKKGGFTYKSRAKSALMGMGFKENEFNLPVSSLSGGQKTRLELVKLLLSDHNLLLLDEPTNHLDIKSVEWLEDFLINYGGAFVVISHDRYFLDRVTSKTFDLDHGRIKTYNANYSNFIKQKEEAKKAQENRYNNTVKEINRLEKIIEQQKRWNREKNIITAESKQKAINRLEKTLERPDEDNASIHFSFSVKKTGGNDVLLVKDLKKSFNNNTVFKNISFHIKRNDRVFMIGPNGCGKSTLFKIILGELKSDYGEIQIGTNVETGYYDQAQENINFQKTVIGEVWDTYPHLTQTEIRNALAAFLFCGDDVFKPISALSGGEKARVLLLKLMLSGANFLLLDEPTNHLDIFSREALENALLNYEGTLFAVSHDRYFINKLAQRVIYLRENEAKAFLGNYDYFLENFVEDSYNSHKKEKKQTDYFEKKEREREFRKLKSTLEKTELKIEEIENLIAQKNQELMNCTADYKKAMELNTETNALNQELMSLYQLWDDTQNKLNNK